MTMHLAQGLTTTRTAKPTIKKLTKLQHQKLEQDLKAFNKRMKSQGRHDERMTFEQYFDYVYGLAHKPRPQEQKFKELKWAPQVRETKYIPSADSTHRGAIPKPEKKEYTGTLIKGIATMHKSNAVPVIDDQHAKDIAKMRR